MNKNSRNTYVRASLAVALATAVGVAGTVATAAECQNPEALTFALVPTEETVAELTLYKPVTDRMAKLTGKKIQFFMPTSYASVVEGMLSKFIHVAVMGPYSYVIANDKDKNIEVFATYAKRKGHMQEEGPGYRAALITKAGSKFTTIESLKGSTLALADPGSTSGNLMPRVVFGKKIGMDLDKYFGKVIYSGSHENSTVAVINGKVDAAFVATHRFDNVVNKKEAKLEDVNILWKSAPIPQDPFVYRSELCEPVKKAIRDTFLGLGEEANAQAFLKNVKSDKFVPMTSADYDIIRDIKAAKDAKKKTN